MSESTRSRIEAISNSLPAYMQDYIAPYQGTTALHYAYQLQAFARAAKAIGRGTEKADWLALPERDIPYLLAHAGGYGQNPAAARLLKRFLKSLQQSVWKEEDPVPPSSALHVRDTADDSRLLSMAENGERLSPHQRAYCMPQWSRDMSLLRILMETGMKMQALSALNLQDAQERRGGIEADGHFFPLTSRTMNVLMSYLLYDRPEPKDGSFALFVSARLTRLSVRSIERIVSKYLCDRKGGALTPRDMRKRYLAGQMRDFDELEKRMREAGVCSAATLDRYRKAARKL